MKCWGALCSRLELHRQYFQEHHHKFESLTFQKSPSITSGTALHSHLRLLLKMQEGRVLALQNKAVSSSAQIVFFLQDKAKLWASIFCPVATRAPAQPPLRFSGRSLVAQQISVCVCSWEHHRVILGKIITSDPAQRPPDLQEASLVTQTEDGNEQMPAWWAAAE